MRRADGGYGLRWFTPTVEVELCGHATLASAHVLWTEGRVRGTAGDPVRHAPAARWPPEPGDGGAIWLDFPATRPSRRTRRPGWSRPSGRRRRAGSGRDRFDYLVELEDEAAVRGAVPRPRGR